MALAFHHLAEVSAGHVAALRYRLGGHALTLREMAGAGLALCLAAIVPRRGWRVARLAVTAVHESGHAVAASLTGRRVTAVHLRPDSSGATYHRGDRRWLPGVVTAGAGYPMPGVVGMAGAWLTAHDHAGTWLVALTVLGVISLALWVRNLFGVVSTAAAVGALGWLAMNGSRGADTLMGAAGSWFLLLGGLRAGAELVVDRGANDGADLARLLHLPAGLGKAVLFLTTALLAAGGAALLLGLRMPAPIP